MLNQPCGRTAQYDSQRHTEPKVLHHASSRRAQLGHRGGGGMMNVIIKILVAFLLVHLNLFCFIAYAYLALMLKAAGLTQ